MAKGSSLSDWHLQIIAFSKKKKEKSVAQIDFSLFSVSSLIDLSLITQCWLLGVSVIFLAASEAREHGCAAGARRARGD